MVVSAAEYFTRLCRIPQLRSQAPGPRKLATDQALTPGLRHTDGETERGIYIVCE